MQFKAFIITTLASVAAAESLSDAIADFPSCSLKCFGDEVSDQGCSLTDFNCICDHQVQLAVSLGTCAGNDCKGVGDSFDVGQALGDLCVRWHEDPPTSEVSAATSTLGAAVASATVVNSTAVDARPAVGIMGLAAAAAALVF
ncbi:hypothetical protein PFICI_12544 [Pestalotiopsis fici W106-1]|uniref:CFEM domain-containing protein n=1 Tax=Pestalotiopsis fici (strain W106-1 / CGMCC3.15140) TaxID=1229662 RepID=W3WNV9_PESFW|nr:uncharacterized protein PFICI_12544 [Pestalotiopsis fici W106-1]ETS75600.1 hypothetical protein PFICI_12544 [Pestalotiopsis fici W106-1]